MTIKTMMRSAIAALAVGFAALPASAAVPVYPTPGAENPAIYTFTAAGNGNLVAYFAGVSAAFENILGAKVNGVDRGLSTLNSLASAGGDSYDFGAVALGDLLEFYIHVNPDMSGTPEYVLSSDPLMNADGVNHVYSEAYAGGDFSIPPGTYVVFEDLYDGGDFNYSDLGFVFTNVETTVTSAVPEPGTWLLMIVGFGAIGFSMRSRTARVQFA